MVARRTGGIAAVLLRMIAALALLIGVAAPSFHIWT